jgi:hypothetical protein
VSTIDASPNAYRPQSSDTTEEADRLLFEAYRHMTPAEKALRMAEDCRALEALAVAGIRTRHPRANEREVRFRLAELRFGCELAIEVYGPLGEERDP